MKNYTSRIKERLKAIKELLEANPRGMTITDVSDRININRNSVARYMDILSVSGQVEVRQFGPAKVFYLSQRIPISAMLDFSSDYILTLDANLRILQVNENFLKLLNTEREAMIGRNMKDFPNPDFTNQEMFSRIREALDGKEIRFEMKFQVAEMEHYFNVTILPTVFEDGSQGITWILQDFTERRKTEDALKNSEAKYRAYLENSPEYSYMISPEGKILDASKSALEVLGYTKEELLDKPLLSTVYAPSSQEKAREIFEKWKEHGKIKNQELEIITKEGEKRTVLLSAHSVKDANGKLLYSVSIQRDITERKRAEKVIESLAKFPSENPYPVLRIAKDGRIMYANTAGSRLLSKWNRKTGQIAPNEWQQTINDIFNSNESREVEAEHNGRRFSLVFVPVTGADYVNIYGRDVTELKKAG